MLPFLFCVLLILFTWDRFVVTQDNSITNLLPPIEKCGQETVTTRIIGGHQTNLTFLPWLALLESKDGELDCGGALISNRYVLTAAHCLGDLVSVRLGENNIKTDPDCDGSGFCADPVLNVKIEKQITHDSYILDGVFYDIALLRLKDEVDFTKFIKPICLPLSPEFANSSFIGNSAWVAGWGQIENGWRSNIKLAVVLPVISNNDCSEKYAKNGHRVVESQICAGGEEGKDSCYGDSGGPLMIRKLGAFYSIGIVSHGLRNGCGLEGVPGVYTRVTAYLQWILDNLKP